RRGTAHIIKTVKPIVNRIVIDGYRRAYEKKGLLIKNRNELQSMVIKKPIEIDYENDTIDEIVKKIEFGIEQHPSFLKVISVEEYKKQEEELDKQRTFWDMY
ncbi:MAG: 1-acyl-sn-glycerol-3-phosphate acyltransferase, partial [Lutibacter sp.]|nr:1-acyl-sn-glycerol-3-phosphate acyltransferase [Lutibacter sp.]